MEKRTITTLFAPVTLMYSLNVFAEEFKPKEIASFFPGTVQLIPADEKPKYSSLPKETQEELDAIRSKWTPSKICKIYNDFTKITHLQWCLPADFDPYADRSATRNYLTNGEINVYDAKDVLELQVSVYGVKPLSMLQVEVQNSLGTIIRNAAYPHDKISEDPYYRANLETAVTSINAEYHPVQSVQNVPEIKKKDLQDHDYTLPFKVPAGDFYTVILRIVSLEELQEQVPVDPLFQGMIRYLPTDGTHQPNDTNAYMRATVVIKQAKELSSDHDEEMWKANPEPTPWDKKETVPVEFNGW